MPLEQTASELNGEISETLRSKIVVLNCDLQQLPVEIVPAANNHVSTDRIIISKDMFENSLIECLDDETIMINANLINNNFIQESLVLPVINSVHDSKLSFEEFPSTEQQYQKEMDSVANSNVVNNSVLSISTVSPQSILPVYTVLQENVLQDQIIATKTTDNNIEMDKENIPTIGSKDFNDTFETLEKVFTMPIKYLSKKKKAKLIKTGKSKLPSVGTSEEWWKIQKEKEQVQKLKEEKAKKKKELQEQKKKIAEEKRLLQEKMKAIQKQIKQETV